MIDVGGMKVAISGDQKVVRPVWHGMCYVLTSYSSASSTWASFLYWREQNMMYVCSIGWLLVVHHSMVSVHTSQMWIKSPNLVLQYKEITRFIAPAEEEYAWICGTYLTRSWIPTGLDVQVLHKFSFTPNLLGLLSVTKKLISLLVIWFCRKSQSEYH